MLAFGVEDLIDCYRRGIFPMADDRQDDEIILIDPDQRGVLPLDGVQISRRLARTIRNTAFQVTHDQAFEAIVGLCAQAASNRPSTWISHGIEALYTELHHVGLAHSMEVWDRGELVGGLYGVSLGAAFFGESMVSRRTDASKIALIHLCARLRAGGFQLLDTQFNTEHLAQFGTIEIPRAEYHRRLARALEGRSDFDQVPDLTGSEALQLITQAS